MNRIKKLIYIFLMVLFSISVCNIRAVNTVNNNSENYNIISVSNMSNDNQSESDSNQSNGFDFIKSDKISSSIFEHNEILLYGGIFLIAVSVIGIVFTIMPRGNKDRRRSRKRSAKH